MGDAGVERGVIAAAAALAPADIEADPGARRDAERCARLDVERSPRGAEIVEAEGQRDARRERPEGAARRSGELDRVLVGGGGKAGQEFIADARFELEAADIAADADLDLGLAVGARRIDVLPQSGGEQGPPFDLAADQELGAVGLRQPFGIAAAREDEFDRGSGRRQIEHM